MGLISEGSEDMVPNSEHEGAANDGPTLALQDAQELFDNGCAALRADDYDTAIEDFSRALEIRVQHFGELAPELASTYYKYGCALLYKVQAESDVLGSSVAAKEEPSAPSTIADKEEAKDVENSDGDESEEEFPEEESDLELAWKMLDIARVIHEKQHTHTIEEVDVITALGDISLEKEDFQTSFEDYTRALEILKGLVEPHNRHLAELYFKIALVQELGGKLQEAIDNCMKASSVCEARLQRLKAEEESLKTLELRKGRQLMEEEPVASENGTAPDVEEHAQKKTKVFEEIQDIEQLLLDLKEKVEDLHEMESAPPRVLDATHLPPALDFVKQALMAAAASKLTDSKAKVEVPSQTQPISSSFGEIMHSSSSANDNVTHLGVVGRGVKRTAPIAIPSSSELKAPEVQVPKRSFDDLMQGNGSGETAIGFSNSVEESTSADVYAEVLPAQSKSTD